VTRVHVTQAWVDGTPATTHSTLSSAIANRLRSVSVLRHEARRRPFHLHRHQPSPPPAPWQLLRERHHAATANTPSQGCPPRPQCPRPHTPESDHTILLRRHEFHPTSERKTLPPRQQHANPPLALLLFAVAYLRGLASVGARGDSRAFSTSTSNLCGGSAFCQLIAGGETTPPARRPEVVERRAYSTLESPRRPRPRSRRLPLVNSIPHPTTADLHMVVDRQSLVRGIPTGVDCRCAGALPHLLSAPARSTIATISSTARDGSSSTPQGRHLQSGHLPAKSTPSNPHFPAIHIITQDDVVDVDRGVDNYLTQSACPSSHEPVAFSPTSPGSSPRRCAPQSPIAHPPNSIFTKSSTAPSARPLFPIFRSPNTNLPSYHTRPSQFAPYSTAPVGRLAQNHIPVLLSALWALPSWSEYYFCVCSPR
jgi:hypothetical protein